MLVTIEPVSFLDIIENVLAQNNNNHKNKFPSANSAF